MVNPWKVTLKDFLAVLCSLSGIMTSLSELLNAFFVILFNVIRSLLLSWMLSLSP